MFRYRIINLMAKSTSLARAEDYVTNKIKEVIDLTRSRDTTKDSEGTVYTF